MTAAAPMLFSIIMPAYNEEAVIEATIRDLAAYLDNAGLYYELIVVDDASADRTAEIVSGLAAENPAIRRSSRACRPKSSVSSDSGTGSG